MADQSLRKYRQYIDCEMLLNRITEEEWFYEYTDTGIKCNEEIRLFSELGANESFLVMLIRNGLMILIVCLMKKEYCSYRLTEEHL